MFLCQVWMRDAEHADRNTHLHLALIAWIEISWKEACALSIYHCCWNNKKSKTKSEHWTRNLKNRDSPSYFIYCPFCPWERQQSSLLTDDIATGICACWQSMKVLNILNTSHFVQITVSQCWWTHFSQCLCFWYLRAGLWLWMCNCSISHSG